MSDESDEPPPRKKRKASKSPTSRTLEECRRLEWTAQVVEHRVPRVNILRDLFGVIDVVAIAGRRIGSGWILGIQACAATDHSKRRAKILAEPRALQWVQAGGRLELWSWAKQGAAGKRKRWGVRVEVFTAESWSKP